LDWPGGESSPTLTRAHWAAGQKFAERWRASTHRLLLLFEDVETNEVEDRLLVRLKEAGVEGLTLRDLYRAMNMRRAEVEQVLNGLVADGVAEQFTPEREGPGRPTMYYRVS
jgi:hypothetical protein